MLARRRKTEKPDSPLLAGDLLPARPEPARAGAMVGGRAAVARGLAIREKATPDDWSRYDAMSLLGGAALARAGTPRPSRWSSRATRG